MIGGGNTAIDVAREALRLGADEVTLVYRRTETRCPPIAHEVEEAREEGVRFRLADGAASASSEASGSRASSAGVPRSASPTRAAGAGPSEVPGSEFVVRRGHRREGDRPAAARRVLRLDRRARARPAAGRVDPETGQTGNPKYFAAGDAINGGATVVEAVRGAKIAAPASTSGSGGGAMREIRWHARAGQGAKTASQLLATAALRAGKSVQAFPEYGPERRGAPLRAYTRVDERPIRRHDSVDAARRRRRARAVAPGRGRRDRRAGRRRPRAR